MSAAVPPRQTFTTAWRGKTPGYAEFNALLNLLDQPALLVDAHRGAVLGANAEFLKLTAFTIVEVTSTELNQLLPELDPPPYLHFEAKANRLVRHNREAVRVIPRATPLDNTGQWQLLELLPVTDVQQVQTEEERQEKLLNAVRQMAGLIEEANADACIKMATRIGADLVGSSLFCIYKADTLSPQLLKVSSIEPESEPFFPGTLPSINLIRLETPVLWLPGKKVASELHREAR
ncbi:MAG TPA: PAS domain-containing protein, partial [Anaerolineaceae bacterium]